MAYLFFIDGVALPVTPSKLQLKIKNQNKSMNLITEGEVNILKDAGLTEISFEAMIPQVRHPFSFYPQGFKDAQTFLNKFEKLKTDKKPFQFIVTRRNPAGKTFFDTNLKVSLEEYQIEEDAKNGLDLTVQFKLKQFRAYGTKTIQIQPVQKTAKKSSTRSTETAPSKKTHKVVRGDTLWAIAKRYLGKGSRYMEIFNLNKDKIKNPNLIYVGQVLTLPS